MRVLIADEDARWLDELRPYDNFRAFEVVDNLADGLKAEIKRILGTI